MYYIDVAQSFVQLPTAIASTQKPKMVELKNTPSSPPMLITKRVQCNESKQEEINPFTTIPGPPIETKPNYSKIIGPLGPMLDRLFLVIFRSKMAQEIGKQYDSMLPEDDYEGLMELASTMNKKYSKEEVQLLSQSVLRSLFPSWLPNSFGWMFAAPFPAFSSRMNAWATYTFGTWLMGECEVNDCKIDGDSLTGDDKNGIQQGLLVKRCRFLEESGCASVCVNSCKIPTQKFFMEDMGLPLTMTPDYETFECQFSFGLTPTLEDEILAKTTPCLARCPSSGAVRKRHLEDQKKPPRPPANTRIRSAESQTSDDFCFMMDD